MIKLRDQIPRIGERELGEWATALVEAIMSPQKAWGKSRGLKNPKNHGWGKRGSDQEHRGGRGHKMVVFYWIGGGERKSVYPIANEFPSVARARQRIQLLVVVGILTLSKVHVRIYRMSWERGYAQIPERVLGQGGFQFRRNRGFTERADQDRAFFEVQKKGTRTMKGHPKKEEGGLEPKRAILGGGGR